MLIRPIGLAASIALAAPIFSLSFAASTAQEQQPGDARFDAVLRRLMQEGARQIPNTPKCPTITDKGATKWSVTIADAFAGALRREGESGKSLRFSLLCTRAGTSRTTEECRLLVSAADGDQESSTGFAFEAPADSANLNMSTVRCTMTP